MSTSNFIAKLLHWFDQNRRYLPWRLTNDPYAVWLSEIIMQQTRISQGTAYWERFMETYPTVEDLATASEDDVLKLWQGLGYYSRARNLHKAAQQIVALGHFPDTMEGLLQLRGVGEYTAAAIASFAFGQPTAAVDGNYFRVLSRVYGIDTPINSTEGKHEFQALADSLGKDYRTINAAIMDFGALQCTPKSPACIVCPLVEDCIALREGRVDLLPVKLKTVHQKTRHLVYLYLRCLGKVAIRRRGKGDIWQGLWEPVLIEQTPSDDKTVTSSTAKQLLAHASLLRSNVKHILTHQILLADFYLLETSSRPAIPPDYVWIDEQNLDQYAIPRLIEILFEALPAPNNHLNE